MKRIIYIVALLFILSINSALSSNISNQIRIELNPLDSSVYPNNDSIDKRFENWTEEQYKQYEDSIKAILYPPVTIHKTDFPSCDNPTYDSNEATPIIINSSVPNSIDIDTSKEVGEINIISGSTPTGAKTYEVPIEVYPGIRDFTPNLSFKYNSQQGRSLIGTGWSISGLPIISRCNKSIYYDDKTEGIIMNNSDAFMLDGIRLLKTDNDDSYISYESEQGNIKAKGYLTGDIIKYFEVFYPNGDKGIFGFPSNNSNHLYYPLTVLSDLYGNKIIYSYTYLHNHYNISQISYNGASVVFSYISTRPDQIRFFAGGLNVSDSQLLGTVTCKFGSTVISTYNLTYQTINNRALLTQISYEVAEQSFNPLRFYYDTNKPNTNYGSYYNASTTQLTEWYSTSDPKMIKVAKGKFDYDSNADGLLVVPNFNPYWKYYRNPTPLSHSQNVFINMYTGKEKIFIYSDLNTGLSSYMPHLLTEYGFIDILCGDFEGKQEEYIVKINNKCTQDNDDIIFQVYKSNLFYGISKLYTRTYSFRTVCQDASGGLSVQPKFYFTGDFNGNGKMEVLAVSVHQPFGDTAKPSKCYIFNLTDNKILFEDHVFPYNIEFIGTQQSDIQAAENLSDKLFVFDYDGDGKSDICHINDDGVNVYTFEYIGANLTARKIATYKGLNKTG